MLSRMAYGRAAGSHLDSVRGPPSRQPASANPVVVADGGDNCRLGVRATNNNARLAGAQACHSGDRNHGRGHTPALPRTVIAPAATTVAITAFSMFPSASLTIVWPAARPVALANDVAYSGS